MQLRTKFASALAAVGIAAAVAYAPTASADVGFNLSFAGPGYGVTVGNYGYYDHWRPAPVVVAPYAPYYRPYYPRPVYVAPPVVYKPYPVYRPYYRDSWRHDHRGGHRHGYHGGHRHDHRVYDRGYRDGHRDHRYR